MPSNTEIAFTLNGRATEASVSVSSCALTMLRETFDLTGTKLACGEGECGACTVLIDDVNYYSCSTLTHRVRDREITTVEGLERPDGTLHPVQQAFVDEWSSVRYDGIDDDFDGDGQYSDIFLSSEMRVPLLENELE